MWGGLDLNKKGRPIWAALFALSTKGGVLETVINFSPAFPLAKGTSPLPSGSPLRLSVLDVVVGQALYICAVGVHHVDFPVAVAVALEGDPGPIG